MILTEENAYDTVTTNRCKVCHRIFVRRYTKSPQERRERYAADPDHREKVREWGLRRNFGMSIEDYEALLIAQDGACAICRKPPPPDRALAVDHDHACCPGRRTCGACNRGLLCTNCNNGLGRFKDSPELLIAALEYLRGVV